VKITIWSSLLHKSDQEDSHNVYFVFSVVYTNFGNLYEFMEHLKE
jgi:hypothetical protein